MMINDGPECLVAVEVVVGVSVISCAVCSIPATHQEFHLAQIKNERFCAFQLVLGYFVT